MAGKIGNHFKAISQRFLVLPLLNMKKGAKEFAIVSTFIISLTAFVNQAHAWSKETHEKFIHALNTSKALNVLVNKTSSLSDSVAVNQNLVQIDSLSSNLKSEISGAILSMHRDFKSLIMDDKADALRNDVKNFKEFANKVGDSLLKKEASNLEKYMDNLIQERILAGKIVKEAINNSYNGRLNKAEEQIKELLNMVEKYSHLTMYVYIEGVIPVLEDFKEYAINAAYNGNFKVANNIVRLTEDIARHEKISVAKDITFKEIIEPMREEITYKTLIIVKNLSKNNKFNEAEKLLKEVNQKYPEQKSLLLDTEHQILKDIIEAIEANIRNDNFNEAKIILKNIHKKYSNYSQEIKQASYDFGLGLIDHTKQLIRNQYYKEAYEFLSYWEKEHFKGSLKDLRAEIARQIEIQSRGSYNRSDAESKLNWARKFRG